MEKGLIYINPGLEKDASRCVGWKFRDFEGWSMTIVSLKDWSRIVGFLYFTSAK